MVQELNYPLTSSALYKCFVYKDLIDKAMIRALRYLIYKYILENWENPTNPGDNLLWKQVPEIEDIPIMGTEAEGAVIAIFCIVLDIVIVTVDIDNKKISEGGTVSFIRDSESTNMNEPNVHVMRHNGGHYYLLYHQKKP